MSDTGFTPGPWRASHSCVISASGEIVTSCVIGNVERGDDAEDYATAHLIAAAPELYEALLGLMMHFLADENGQLPPDLYDSPLYNEGLRELYPRAIATLAKARGES